MKKHVCLVVAALAAASSVALAADKPAAGAAIIEAKGPTGGAVAGVVEIEATVTAIDKEKRTVTVKGPKRTAVIAVSEEARNFDQIKVGDMVKLKYVEAISLQLDKAPGAKPGMVVTEEMVRAKKGEKPSGAVQRKVTVVGTVTAIDEKAQLVTVKGPEGNEVDIKVQDAAKLKNVKTGDLVKATYTEALVVSVTTPAKEPAKAPAKEEPKKK